MNIGIELMIIVVVDVASDVKNRKHLGSENASLFLPSFSCSLSSAGWQCIFED